MALVVGLSLLSSQALASDQFESRFTGFATLGLVTSDHETLGFRRDLTQDVGVKDGSVEWRTDSLIGLQWQGSWSPKLAATVQAVAKDRYDNSLENSIEWAFLRYRPVDGLDIRLGRLGSDLFMLSDYRQVGYAFPWVRPPTDYYGLMSLYHYDGMDINKRFDLENGTLNVKVFYGNSDEHYPVTDSSADEIRMDISPAGLALSLEWNEWTWRYTYADVTINNDAARSLTDAFRAASPLWPEATAIADRFSTYKKSMVYHEFGAEWDNNVWWMQAEATDLSSGSPLTPSGRHFYVSVGRRFGALSVFGIGGLAKPEGDVQYLTAPAGYPSPIGEQLDVLANAASYSLRSVRLDQDSIGLGLRWDFRPKTALKFQVDRFNIDEAGTGLWTTNSAQPYTENQKSTVISLSMDFLF